MEEQQPQNQSSLEERIRSEEKQKLRNLIQEMLNDLAKSMKEYKAAGIRIPDITLTMDGRKYALEELLKELP